MILPLVSSYVGDVVDLQHRTAMGYLTSAGMFSKAVGPFVSGWTLAGEGASLERVFDASLAVDGIPLFIVLQYTPGSLTISARKLAEQHHQARLDRERSPSAVRIWLRRANILNPIYRLFERACRQPAMDGATVSDRD